MKWKGAWLNLHGCKQCNYAKNQIQPGNDYGYVPGGRNDNQNNDEEGVYAYEWY